MPNRRYERSPTAVRDIERLDPEDRRRIFEALDRLVGAVPNGDVRKLEGSSDEWRLRSVACEFASPPIQGPA